MSAGLSLGQAARRLGVTREQLTAIEEHDAVFAGTDPAPLAELYGVNLDWLSGRSELRDCEPLKSMQGAEDLPFRDRDMLAELYASLPRRTS